MKASKDCSAPSFEGLTDDVRAIAEAYFALAELLPPARRAALGYLVDRIESDLRKEAEAARVVGAFIQINVRKRVRRRVVA